MMRSLLLSVVILVATAFTRPARAQGTAGARRPVPAVVPKPPPPPAMGAPGGGTPATFRPEHLRCDKSAGIVADSDAPPSDSCWAAATGAGKSTYALQTASKSCVAGLPLSGERKTVMIGREGTYSVDNVPVVAACTLDQNGPVHFDTLAGLTAPQRERALAGTLSSTADGGPVFSVASAQAVANAEAAGATSPCDWSHVPTAYVSGRGDEVYVGIDISQPTASVALAPPRNVLRPNQGVIVGVCHAKTDAKQLQVSLGGTQALTAPTNNGAAQDALAVTPIGITEYRFAPRAPGAANITLSDVSGAKPVTLATVELQVDTLYWGAVRFGLGTLFSNWNGYAITTFAGSNQAEVQSAHEAVAFEIVNGFAPYLFDIIACSGHGGRSETGGCNAYVAPYIGYGLLGASSQGIQALSSIHVGLEFEFAQNFSVATNFVMKRTSGLKEGYEPGSPVLSTMSIGDVTRDTWQPGFALVVNATPSFLQFATGSSSSGSSATTGKKGGSQ